MVYTNGSIAWSLLEGWREPRSCRLGADSYGDRGIATTVCILLQMPVETSSSAKKSVH